MLQALGLNQPATSVTDPPESPKVMESDNPSNRDEMIKNAHLGDAKAQYLMGVAYYFGQGVAIDNKEAFKWFTKSAEQGNDDAQAMLGAFYLNGIVVKKDPILAYAWHDVAISNGNEVAEVMIKGIELTPEQLIEAEALSTEIYKRTDANRKN